MLKFESRQSTSQSDFFLTCFHQQYCDGDREEPLLFFIPILFCYTIVKDEQDFWPIARAEPTENRFHKCHLKIFTNIYIETEL
ncbi:hypothetical protein Krac_12281 [Ktedonobacter racemifer DSM 44963]|uniref:Uncharacterized protein n=1 Tax=Ktedonobacter racemifer DSM 44963 TaxID=485913 RepID=D6TGE2_KTERA|nr:hypothetical protein Krac_12281 [Ktedonobacter racemifer DSM 44963]